MYVAVFGNERRGGSKNGLLRGGIYLGTDRLPGVIYGFHTFPVYRSNVPDDVGVLADIYEIPPTRLSILKKLDEDACFYPEAPSHSLTLRKEVVTLEGGLPVLAYEYKYDPVNATIPSGDWFVEVEERSKRWK